MSKVLIVEDDPLVSRMYQTVFQFEGFDVEMARNGEEGIEKLKSFKPIMILLDIMMPKMSGIDVLRIIKNNPDLKNIPVVVLTNLSGDKDVDTALDLGAVKYIVKSQNKPKEIVAQIKEILAGYTREEIPKAATKN
ncbi:MAG TPA: response regulator [Patescibacteria group bacterium]|nr:response regulator [Patescibacteria group bacterium]